MSTTTGASNKVNNVAANEATTTESNGSQDSGSFLLCDHCRRMLTPQALNFSDEDGKPLLNFAHPILDSAIQILQINQNLINSLFGVNSQSVQPSAPATEDGTEDNQ